VHAVEALTHKLVARHAEVDVEAYVDEMVGLVTAYLRSRGGPLAAAGEPPAERLAAERRHEVARVAAAGRPSVARADPRRPPRPAARCSRTVTPARSASRAPSREDERHVREGGRRRVEQAGEQRLARHRAERSAPRTTSVTPIARSSTTQASW
jgi:hypothetical protein